MCRGLQAELLNKLVRFYIHIERCAKYHSMGPSAWRWRSRATRFNFVRLCYRRSKTEAADDGGFT
jgi:hypothetical protein